MDGDPYADLVSRLRKDAREQSSTLWRLGKVISSDPLTINVAGINLSKDDLMTNAYLLEHEENVSVESISGTLSASVDCSQGAISSLTISEGDITAICTVKSALSVGDTVLLLPVDSEQQKFIVLCKVVAL